MALERLYILQQYVLLVAPGRVGALHRCDLEAAVKSQPRFLCLQLKPVTVKVKLSGTLDSSSLQAPVQNSCPPLKRRRGNFRGREIRSFYGEILMAKERKNCQFYKNNSQK